MLAALEHPTLDLLLCLDRRQVGEAQEILALVVGAFGCELLPALIVDHARDGIREGSGIRIAGGLGADGITLNHPAATQPEHAVQARAERSHLRGRR